MNTKDQRRLLREAALWHSRICNEEIESHHHDAWIEWLNTSPDHRWAWSKIKAMQEHLNKIPRELPYSSLLSGELKRRKFIKASGIAVAAFALGSAGYEWERAQGRLSAFRSGIGDRLMWRLADGSRLTLDTDSIADTNSNNSPRFIYLYRGALHLEIPIDLSQQKSNFLIECDHGDVALQSGRVCVRHYDNRLEIAILAGTALITPQDMPKPILVKAGHSVILTKSDAMVTPRIPTAMISWVEGWLIVDEWRLGALISELGRYQKGFLTCSSSVSNLRLSGSYRLADIDEALATIEAALPIRFQRFSRLWIRAVSA